VIARIVSGGQTGADRAALDVAAEVGIPAGGWVPRGRAAEDGRIPARYDGLRETAEDDPAVRTRLNVRDSDATVAITHGAAAGGTRRALEEAARLGRAALHLDLNALGEPAAAERLIEWLAETRAGAVNVAGPRAGEDPEIYAAVLRVLRAALPPLLLRPPERLETARLLLRPPRPDDADAIFSYARALGMVELRLRGRTADLGYVLAREHWGRGLVPEAVARVRDWVLAQTGVRRLWALCDAENHGSARVLEKCGFVREEGVRHAYHPNAGPEVRECLRFAIVP
jgi:RimJ/RimL family protein N-acetyltransferase